MAKKKLKVRASGKKGYAVVKAILFHPMETGLRKSKETGQVIPAHYIQEVSVKHKDAEVIKVNMGIAVSKNPYLSVEIDGAVKGDQISIGWLDNLGESASTDVTVS